MQPFHARRHVEPVSQSADERRLFPSSGMVAKVEATAPGHRAEVELRWFPILIARSLCPVCTAEDAMGRRGFSEGAHLDALSHRILGASYAVHSALGPGLLESAYEACLEHELQQLGLQVERQQVLPVHYKKVRVDAGYRIDLVVESAVILEIKSVRGLLPIHRAQLLTYLKLSGLHLGLLLNFNVPRLKDGGICRLVHDFPG